MSRFKKEIEKFGIEMYYVYFGHEDDPNTDTITDEQLYYEALIYQEYLFYDMMHMFFSYYECEMRPIYEEFSVRIVDYNPDNPVDSEAITELIKVLPQYGYSMNIDTMTISPN